MDDINAKDNAEPAIVLEGDAYPTTSRMIDVGAFLVLAGGVFLPIARLAFRTLRLVETDAALTVAGAALVGLLAALGRYRRIAVISAIVYGGVFALFIVNYHEKIAVLREKLKDNPFGGLAEAMIGLDWGCAVITLGVLAVLCSNAIVRRVYQS